MYLTMVPIKKYNPYCKTSLKTATSAEKLKKFWVSEIDDTN